MSSAPGSVNAMRPNPEQLYVAALSACQALTYLFLAARGGVAVTGYSDDAVGELATVDGAFRMATVKLRPHITLEPGADAGQAQVLVERATSDASLATRCRRRSTSSRSSSSWNRVSRHDVLRSHSVPG